MQIEYKGYRIAGLETFAMCKIMPKGSGDIPKELDGYFTKVDLAKQQIDGYLGSLVNKKRNTTNGKKESASSGKAVQQGVAD